jgi:hypothetical protein
VVSTNKLELKGITNVCGHAGGVEHKSTVANLDRNDDSIGGQNGEDSSSKSEELHFYRCDVNYFNMG